MADSDIIVSLHLLIPFISMVGTESANYLATQFYSPLMLYVNAVVSVGVGIAISIIIR
jgi:hypothetical protein